MSHHAIIDIMSEEEKTQYLENYYYNIRNPAAYTSHNA
jgi:hypothetical protein